MYERPVILVLGPLVQFSGSPGPKPTKIPGLDLGFFVRLRLVLLTLVGRRPRRRYVPIVVNVKRSPAYLAPYRKPDRRVLVHV